MTLQRKRLHHNVFFPSCSVIILIRFIEEKKNQIRGASRPFVNESNCVKIVCASVFYS